MVFLFDDTSEDYTRKYINLPDYSPNVLRYVHRAKLSDFIYYQDDLKKADCILIHRSFQDSDNPGSHDFFRKVVQLSANGEIIPLVIFSDGDRELADFKSDRFIRQIKKQKFYERLKSFLEDYRSTKIANLKIIGYGDKSDYLLAVSEAHSILSKIRFLASDDVISPEMVAGQDLVSFVERSQPSIGCSYSDIISDLQNGNITAGRFREIINVIVKSFNNYGKNTHPWR